MIFRAIPPYAKPGDGRGDDMRNQVSTVHAATEGLTVAPRRRIGRDAWNAFADGSDDAWLYHRDELAEAVAVRRAAADHSFALVAADGSICATMALASFDFTRARGRLRVAEFISLGGPAVTNSAAKAERDRLATVAIEAALEIARANAGVTLEVLLPPLTPAIRGDLCPRVNPLCSLGLKNALTQTWVVDLRSGRDAVWKGMRDRARGEIRKAERNRVSVRPADLTGDLDRYYKLHVETYRRTGVEPHPRSYFERIWSDCMPNGLAHVLIAEVDGEHVASRNFGIYKRAAVYWTGAASERGLEVGAGALLQWSAMEWMIENEIEWSETGEAFPGAFDAKLRGLSLHKAGFGGELYPLYRGRRALGHRAYETVLAFHRLRETVRR